MRVCPKCGVNQPSSVLICDCGHKFERAGAAKPAKTEGAARGNGGAATGPVPPRHSTLRALGSVYRVVGVLGLVGGFGRALVVASHETFDVMDVILALVGGALSFIVFFGLGQGVAVLLAIHEDTARLRASVAAPGDRHEG